MIFVYSAKNRGGPLVVSVILTGFFLGAVLMAFGSLPIMSIDSLISIFVIIPLSGLIFSIPGLALAYVLLSSRKNKPKFLSCIFWSTLIGGLISFFYTPIWTELGNKFAFCFFAGGPLTGLFYYLILKQTQEIVSENAKKL